jgi:hypothetical protein
MGPCCSNDLSSQTCKVLHFTWLDVGPSFCTTSITSSTESIWPGTFAAIVFQVKDRKGYRPKQKDWIRDHNDSVKAKMSDHNLNIFVSLTAARPEFQSPDRAPHNVKGSSNPLAIFVSRRGPEQYPSLSTLTIERRTDRA